MNDHDAPTRELFARIDAAKTRSLGVLSWRENFPFPTAEFGYAWFELDTVEKVRAACLLLGIPWPRE